MAKIVTTLSNSGVMLNVSQSMSHLRNQKRIQIGNILSPPEMKIQQFQWQQYRYPNSSSTIGPTVLASIFFPNDVLIAIYLFSIKDNMYFHYSAKKVK
ncbi:MAG: hypothetical protein EHM14_03385 [Methanothrix sp.]|nr:MAG: hypothetical protein EHM14_03385 [Methanothrix sp.]